MATLLQKPRPVMSAGGTQPRPQQSPRSLRARPVRQLRTLKGQFLVQAGLILLLAGVMTLVASTSLNRASNDLGTIDQGSIPSVNYAQGMAQLVSQIDAQAADFLAAAGLTATHPCSIQTSLAHPDQGETLTLTVHDCDAHSIDAETVLLNEQLFNAEHNVTYPGEQTAVERISTALQNYLGDIHQERVDYNLAKSKTDPTDPFLQQAYLAYLAGSAILHEKITLPTLNANQIPLDTETNLPTCQSPDGKVQYSPEQWTQNSLSVALDCLSSINHRSLEQANSDANSFLIGSFWLLLFLGVLLIGLLCFSTVRMTATSHRIINAGLLPAALIALVLGVSLFGLVNSLGKQGDHTGWQADPVSHIDQAGSGDGAFQQMISDDYDSVYDTAILTRYATDANADESRWLIAQEFKDTANIQRWQSDWQENVGQVRYWMQNAQNNLTWTEEESPLQQMPESWNQYYSLDSQIRSDAINQTDPNRLLTAEALSTGNSNRDFARFINTVSQLSAADQGHYNTTRDATSQALGLFFGLSLVLFPLAGLLAVWGIAMRLKDF